MLTIVTTTKPFTGHQKIIQTNAILSWIALRPKCEIILIGNDDGASEFASKHNIKHFSNVKCTKSGLPLLNSFLQIAEKEANHNTIAWISSDIILPKDFLNIFNTPLPKQFLISAQRWNMNIENYIDFSKYDFNVAKKCGKLHPPTAGDLLMFTKGFLKDVPTFIIGRAMYDNWIYYKARAQHIPLIDATPLITIVHQNHEYNTPGWNWKNTTSKQHPEFVHNLKLAGGYAYAFTLGDSTHLLTLSGLKPTPLTKKRLLRKIYTFPALHPQLVPIFNFALLTKSYITKTLRR